jgi:Fic-DOC domain mobile mystery protein B
LTDPTNGLPLGATPLDPDEADGLIPDYISTRGELNSLERENILEAVDWVFRRRHPDILNMTFILDVHKRMFGRVWTWAGAQRNTNKNIGVSKEQIAMELATLFADTAYWIENGTYDWDELGARFHHRLVSIHVFANGNGRHARLMTDLLLRSHGREPFSWGSLSSQNALEVEGPVRQRYIRALRAADDQDYRPLLEFARS